MIPISEKSSGGALVDWVPEGHDRKYTEPAAMSIRIAATPSAWLTLIREARRGSWPREALGRDGGRTRGADVPAREGGHGAANCGPVDENHAAGQRADLTRIDL